MKGKRRNLTKFLNVSNEPKEKHNNNKKRHYVRILQTSTMEHIYTHHQEERDKTRINLKGKILIVYLFMAVSFSICRENEHVNNKMFSQVRHQVKMHADKFIFSLQGASLPLVHCIHTLSWAVYNVLFLIFGMFCFLDPLISLFSCAVKIKLETNEILNPGYKYTRDLSNGNVGICFFFWWWWLRFCMINVCDKVTHANSDSEKMPCLIDK